MTELSRGLNNYDFKRSCYADLQVHPYFIYLFIYFLGGGGGCPGRIGLHPLIFKNIFFSYGASISYLLIILFILQ